MKYVYFLRHSTKRRVKIGYTAEPAARLCQLRSEAGPKCKFLKVISGSRELEHQLHDKFESSRVPETREWFHWSTELSDYINGCESAPFEQTRQVTVHMPVVDYQELRMLSFDRHVTTRSIVLDAICLFLEESGQ